MMVESVTYSALKKIGRVEVRRYPRLVLATVNGMDEDDAFTILFNYISGQNENRRRIAMTVPVVSAQKGEKIPMTAPVLSGSHSFSFVLPSSYTADSAPRPVDARTRIEEVRERRVAVLRFRGSTSSKHVEEKTHELLEALKRNDLRPVGEPFLMRYNPPFIPGIFRRNEVGVELAG